MYSVSSLLSSLSLSLSGVSLKSFYHPRGYSSSEKDKKKSIMLFTLNIHTAKTFEMNGTVELNFYV